MSDSEFGGQAAARLFKRRMLEVLEELPGQKWTKQSPELLRLRVVDIARSCAWVCGCTADTGDALAALMLEVLVVELPDGMKALARG